MEFQRHPAPDDLYSRRFHRQFRPAGGLHRTRGRLRVPLPRTHRGRRASRRVHAGSPRPRSYHDLYRRGRQDDRERRRKLSRVVQGRLAQAAIGGRFGRRDLRRLHDRPLPVHQGRGFGQKAARALDARADVPRSPGPFGRGARRSVARRIDGSARQSALRIRRRPFRLRGAGRGAHHPAGARRGDQRGDSRLRRGPLARHRRREPRGRFGFGRGRWSGRFRSCPASARSSSYFGAACSRRAAQTRSAPPP